MRDLEEKPATPIRSAGVGHDCDSGDVAAGGRRPFSALRRTGSLQFLYRFAAPDVAPLANLPAGAMGQPDGMKRDAESSLRRAGNGPNLPPIRRRSGTRRCRTFASRQESVHPRNPLRNDRSRPARPPVAFHRSAGLVPTAVPVHLLVDNGTPSARAVRKAGGLPVVSGDSPATEVRGIRRDRGLGATLCPKETRNEEDSCSSYNRGGARCRRV